MSLTATTGWSMPMIPTVMAMTSCAGKLRQQLGIAPSRLPVLDGDAVGDGLRLAHAAAGAELHHGPARHDLVVEVAEHGKPHRFQGKPGLLRQQAEVDLETAPLH